MYDARAAHLASRGVKLKDGKRRWQRHMVPMDEAEKHRLDCIKSLVISFDGSMIRIRPPEYFVKCFKI